MQSLRTLLGAFVKPASALDDGLPFRVGATVVVLLCVANAVATAHSAGVVAANTHGSVTVDNPGHPPDWICDQPDTAEQYERYQSACENEPETIDRPLSRYAGNAVGGLVWNALLAPLAVWLAVSGVLVLAFGGASADDPADRVGFSGVMAVTGLGLAPAVLRYAARPLFVERAVADWSVPPATVEGAKTAAVEAMTPEATLYAVVVVATVAWSAYVWRGGWRAVLDTTNRRADAVAVTAAGALAVPAFNPVYFGPEAFPYGVLFLLLGGVGLVFPRVLEHVQLAFDLIGTRGGDNVELKPWRVALEQGVSLLLVLGATLAVGGLYLV